MNFPAFFLLMISSFIIPSWLEMMCMISIYSICKHQFCVPIIWSILGNVLCAQESMCIRLLSSGAFYISIRFIWSKVWIKFNFTLLISCLFAQFTIASGVLKIPTIILLPSCSFRSFSICLTFRCFDNGCNSHFYHCYIFL